jgi:tetratricopeptide (TPR) repeat protein
LWRLGRRDECLRVYGEAIRIAPGYSPGYWGLAYYLEQLGRSDESITVLSTLSQREPQNAGLQARIGLLYADREKYADALPFLRRALELEPHLTDEQPRLQTALNQAESATRPGRDDGTR